MIKHWPEAERPRERILSKDPQALSDAELLAILFGSGLRGVDVVSFSRNLLMQHGGLRGLLSLEPEKLRKIKGLGPAKIAALKAVSEISKRQACETAMKADPVREPSAVLKYLQLSMQDQPVEIFKVLFLDKANKITGESDLFRGTVDEAAVYPREIVRQAILKNATAVILVHNHPSGRVEPSPEDRELTRKVTAACSCVSIRVLDHIVIGDGRYYSFAEHGLLDG
jgi:DNA repair protein RadC